MMAEVDEELRRCKDMDLGINRQTTDLERTKSDHFHSCKGPFSTIRAAIKRTRTNSHSDRTRERRRSEIIIVSSEPLERKGCFSDCSEILPGGIQFPPSYDQAVKEKTQEVPRLKPTTTPRHASSTSASNDSVKDDAAKKSPNKKPQKPPRPLLPKSLQRRNTFAAGSSHVSTKEVKQATTSLTRSVVVCWDTGEKQPEKPVAPVPLPRIKSRRRTETPPLIVVSEGCDSSQVDTRPEKVSTNEYLRELLDVFSTENKETPGIGPTSDQDSDSDMQARIQAFESQVSSEERYVASPVKPKPLPRKANKPPVATKPSVALLPSAEPGPHDSDQNGSPVTQNDTPDARPEPPKKPVGNSVKEELEGLLNKGPAFQRSRPSRLTRVNSIHDEEPSESGAPTPPVRPKKEPLKPNLNINNHNSTVVAVQNKYEEIPSGTPAKPQGPTRRPTTIRVPSKTGPASDSFQDSPPPLPAQKPVGSFRSSVVQKQTSTPILPSQEYNRVGPEPSLPPRRSNTIKALPPRPLAAKPAPGKPPQPSLQATGRSNSVPWDISPKQETRRPHRTEPVLPSRPNPGHRLYNKYTLQLPHGIASGDCHGTGAGTLSFQKNEVLLLLEEIDESTYECQVGAHRGRVSKSQMKIINPLESTATPLQVNSLAGEDGPGLKVQALYDFTSEGPGELGLKAGDIVSMVEPVDSQWYRGTCRGSAGFFPISHVKVLYESPKSIPERKPKPESTGVSGPRCVARFDFEGEHGDELSFSEGDVIQLRAYVGQDWARGQIGTKSGIFPLNFVEVTEDLPQGQSPIQPIKIPLPGLVSTPVVQPPGPAKSDAVEWVVALYDFSGQSDNDLSFHQGDRILVTERVNDEWCCGRINGKEGIFPLAFVEAANTGQPSMKSHDAAGGRAKALYAFTSSCEEELSLQPGDILTNLEKVDDEWFLADLKGRRALVPKNYVQVLV